MKDPAALEPWLGRVVTHTARKVLGTRARRAWLPRFVDSAEQERHVAAAIAFAPDARQALRVGYRALEVLARRRAHRVCAALHRRHGASYLTEVELGQLARYLEELDDVRETIAPPKPEPMLQPTSMNPLGGCSPATSGACGLSSAPAPRHTGVLGVRGWSDFSVAAATSRASLIGHTARQTQICHAVTPL